MFLIRTLCIVYGLALTVGLLMPPLPGGGDVTSVGPFVNYPDLAHFAAFVLLAFLFRLARWPWSFRSEALFLVAHAVGTEMGQSLIPGRTVGFIDGLANLLGIAAGMGVVDVIVKRSNCRRKKINRKNETAVKNTKGHEEKKSWKLWP